MTTPEEKLELSRDLDDCAKLAKQLAANSKAYMDRASLAFICVTLVKARKRIAFLESNLPSQ